MQKSCVLFFAFFNISQVLKRKKKSSRYSRPTPFPLQCVHTKFSCKWAFKFQHKSVLYNFVRFDWNLTQTRRRNFVYSNAATKKNIIPDFNAIIKNWSIITCLIFFLPFSFQLFFSHRLNIKMKFFLLLRIEK